jgi:hypothetical protein
MIGGSLEVKVGSCERGTEEEVGKVIEALVLWSHRCGAEHSRLSGDEVPKVVVERDAECLRSRQQASFYFRV